MSSAVDIRPETAPMPLFGALDGVRVTGFIDESGHRASFDADHATTPVRGITVSSDDCDEGWIFAAVPGLVQHGIRFARQSLDTGAVAILTDEEGASRALADGLSVPVVIVEDVRAAVARASVVIEGAPATRLTTMAVTGTNGKTTTSYLMRAALRVAFEDPAICGTVETRIGPLRFLSDRTTAEAPVIQRFLAQASQEGLGAAVVESSSHALSLHRVDGIVFDVAGFTNLQHDHLDYYGDMNTYFEAKKQLFTPAHAKRGVVCVDDEWGRRLADEAAIPVVTVSALTAQPADWTVRDTHPDQAIGRTVFTLVAPDGTGHRVAMPLLGRVNVQNTVIAIVSAVSLGYDLDRVIDAVENADQIPGRMQKINPDVSFQPLVIVDYAHTPEALEWTLRSTRELTRGRLIIVFGTDGDRDASKREDLAEVAAREADVLWVTDENPRTEDPQSIRDYLMRGIARVRPDFVDVTEVTTSRRDATRMAIQAAGPEDTVILTGKGSEWCQEVMGVKHAYTDSLVAAEVLKYTYPTDL